MSITYDLLCRDCKQCIWVGQKDRIYKTEEHLDQLQFFLFDHMGHSLKFTGDWDEETDEADMLNLAQDYPPKEKEVTHKKVDKEV